MKMYYQRQEVFTLSSILNQIASFAESNKRLPTVIVLPAREYVYLPYLFGDGSREIKTFHGIPVRMDASKTPSEEFSV